MNFRKMGCDWQLLLAVIVVILAFLLTGCPNTIGQVPCDELQAEVQNWRKELDNADTAMGRKAATDNLNEAIEAYQQRGCP